ncbi:hypothetical protein BDA96_05G081900 [Sorghum bicolor]|uniref:Bifunctional inhibitor/plant lipid transfer protein/seed storage helical domain-containing protein n=1 Tax=Sorghum bicolor TaxID=4558 RepID=A0A921QWY5_SORBI|nr:hypothetical protein BDA96_05G081900 [Sorghum bicolor]
MVCSKKTLAIVLMALLASANNFNEQSCGVMCSFLGLNAVGICKVVGGVSSCYVPKPSTSINICDGTAQFIQD